MSEAKLTIDEHVQALGANFPSGRLWAPKSRKGSNLYKLLRGMAPTFVRIDQLIQCFVDESYPPETTAYLEEWEAALGIPDSCLALQPTIAGRQLAIKLKLITMRGVTTSPDFVGLGAEFGVNIRVNAGYDHIPVAQGGYGLALPGMTLSNQADGTFVIATITASAGDPDYDLTGLVGMNIALYYVGQELTVTNQTSSEVGVFDIHSIEESPPKIYLTETGSPVNAGLFTGILEGADIVATQDFVNAKTARFTMVVTEVDGAAISFPWVFEDTGLTGLKFGTDGQQALRCLIEKLKPANTDVLFVEE